MAEGTPANRRKAAALDKALRAMFNRLQARAASDRLLSVVEQLDMEDAPKRKKSGG